MKRYFGYVRVSTPKQGLGVSLQEQRGAILRHAQRHDLKIIEWFEEKETAAKEGRNVFVRMLLHLKQGAADGVIIHKIDRSARNLSDWANLGNLLDQGIDVQFAHDALDMHTRGGRLSADIMAVVAADYVRNLRDEVKKGFYGRLKQGLYPRPAPMGYLDNGAGKPKTIDPVLGPMLRDAFDSYATGTRSLMRLAAEMNEQGFQARRGSALSVQSLSKIFHNPFYVGIIRVGTPYEHFAGLHEPLTTRQTFDRVQELLAGKSVRQPPSETFAFRRLITCGNCKRHLVGERKKEKYIYYRCYTPSCRSTVLKEPEICQALIAVASQISLTPSEVRDLRDIAAHELEGRSKEASSLEQQVQMQLDMCEKRLLKLTDALLDDLINKEDYEARKLGLLKNRQELRDVLQNRPSHSSIQEKILSYLELPLIQEISHSLANPAELREIGEAVAWNFTACGNELGFALYSPYQEIKDWRSSNRVDHVGEELELMSLYESLKDSASKSGQVTEVPKSIARSRANTGDIRKPV